MIKEEEISMPPGIVKPCYPYACLIALALKNSGEGQLSVADIYTFIMENFPYYQHAQPGWKNSIRHNLSLNKSFEKIEQPNTSTNATRKTYLWKMVSGMAEKMETELNKFSTEDVKASLKDANDYEAIRSGTKGMPTVDQRPPDFAAETGSAVWIVLSEIIKTLIVLACNCKKNERVLQERKGAKITRKTIRTHPGELSVSSTSGRNGSRATSPCENRGRTTSQMQISPPVGHWV